MPTYPACPLRLRTKRVAFGVIGLVRKLPRSGVLDVLGGQLVRAATGVAANHRAADRARSRCEIVAKLGAVLEEADDSQFWLEALIECNLADRVAIETLYQEARELRGIFWHTIRAARATRNAGPRRG